MPRPEKLDAVAWWLPMPQEPRAFLPGYEGGEEVLPPNYEMDLEAAGFRTTRDGPFLRVTRRRKETNYDPS